jgi:hypothetical protein
MHAVLETVPPSVLKLPVDWPPAEVSARRSLVDSAPALSRSRESVQLASRRIDLGLPTLCVPDRKWDRRVAWAAVFTATAARHTSTRKSATPK